MHEGDRLKQRKTGAGSRGAGQQRFIPPAAQEISLTDSWVHSSVLFAFQLGHIQMEDREVLKVFTWYLKEHWIFCLTI